MPRAARRRCRFAATVSVLFGALFGLLLCSGVSAGAATGGDPAGAHARMADVAAAALPAAATADTGAGEPTTAGVTADAPAVAVAAADERQVPGCGETPRHDSGTGSVTPPRGGSPQDLLPEPHGARAACASWAVDESLLAMAPDRGPPRLIHHSPIDLSVLLRV
ncbi:hypothetical protein [Streptomyces hypolithicus]